MRSEPATCFIALICALPPDAGDGQPDVDGGPDARVVQVRAEVDLAVGDGDHVRGDVGGDLAFLGLDEGERGEGAAAQLVGEARRALQEARVQVEHVAGVRLAPGRPAQEQGELPVGVGLPREVVVHARGCPCAPRT